MPNVSFAGPLTFDRSQYYNPTKSYINNTAAKKTTVNPKQKAATLFYNFYNDNKDKLPSKTLILKHRYEIENMILQGFLPEEAFEKALPIKS